jgi:hypothetical protein
MLHECAIKNVYCTLFMFDKKIVIMYSKQNVQEQWSFLYAWCDLHDSG